MSEQASAGLTGFSERLAQVSVVLWDLDGTLIDSIELIRSTFDHALRTVLGVELGHDELIQNIGIPLRPQFEAFVKATGADPAKIEEAMAVYQGYYDERHDSMSNAFPGVPEVLSELGRRGYRQGIVTSRRRVSSERSVRLNRLERFFEVIVAMEDAPEYKPLPGPILTALGRLSAVPEEAVYVGDSPFDVRSALAAGTLMVAALWGPFPHERLYAEEPDAAISDVTALLDLLPDSAASSSGT